MVVVVERRKSSKKEEKLINPEEYNARLPDNPNPCILDQVSIIS